MQSLPFYGFFRGPSVKSKTLVELSSSNVWDLLANSSSNSTSEKLNSIHSDNSRSKDLSRSYFLSQNVSTSFTNYCIWITSSNITFSHQFFVRCPPYNFLRSCLFEYEDCYSFFNKGGLN